MTLVADYLTFRGIPHELVPHARTFSSIDEARAVGVSADEVLKALVIRRGEGRALLVLPGSHRVDMRIVREAVGDHQARLATEAELLHDLSYELGALPPLGSLLGMETIVDPEVFLHDTVLFADAQTHSIKVRTRDLFRDERIHVVPLAKRPAEVRGEEKAPVG